MISICLASRAVRRVTIAVLTATLLLAFGSSLKAQRFSRSRSVGGISIDAEGVLDNARLDDLGTLSRLRAQSLEPIPADLNGLAPARKVSLRRLEMAIKKHGDNLPDEVKYLAGLQQIRYVFVYPEQRDIVLVGSGEGWRVDERGYVVGVTTGRPAMLLDDLLVALRTAREAARGGMSCSIDPTPEGLKRLQAHVSRLRTIGNPLQTAEGIANALGKQQVSFTGVPATSHFARVLVAADYRMKRLAMGFESSPVPNLPSFLTIMRSGSSGMSNMLPRWWLEPSYEPILRSPDGLAWELRDSGVKVMTEEDFLAASGNVQHTGKANPLAKKWADSMTAKFDELAVADPIFGQMRNCMELAVVGALIVKEQLPQKANYSMPVLMDPAGVKTEQLNAPKQVNSRVSMLRKGRNWVISASGGVLVNSWVIADKVEQSDAPAPIRTRSAPASSANWRWS